MVSKGERIDFLEKERKFYQSFIEQKGLTKSFNALLAARKFGNSTTMKSHLESNQKQLDDIKGKIEIIIQKFVPGIKIDIFVHTFSRSYQYMKMYLVHIRNGQGRIIFDSFKVLCLESYFEKLKSRTEKEIFWDELEQMIKHMQRYATVEGGRNGLKKKENVIDNCANYYNK